MISTVAVAALSLLLSTPHAAKAGGAGAKRHHGLHGVVTSVSGNSFTLRTGKKNDPNAQEVTVQTNGNTKFVTVANGTRAAGTAASVTVRSHVMVIMNPHGGNTARVVAVIHRKPGKTL